MVSEEARFCTGELGGEEAFEAVGDCGGLDVSGRRQKAVS